MQTRFGLNCSPARGQPLDTLADALSDSLRQRLAARRELLGAERFAELARLLLLSAGDALWENHRAALRAMSAVSRMSAYGPKTAVAEYVIDAADAWLRFRDEASATFLSRLCLFPIADLAGPAKHDPGAPLPVDARLATLAAAAPRRPLPVP